MPQIREYRSQGGVASGIQQQKVSGSDLSGTGAGLAQLGQQVTSTGEMINQRIDQANVSDLNVKLSELNARKAIELEEARRNPSKFSIGDVNDPNSMNTQLMEKYDEEMQELYGSATTRAGQSFLGKAAAEMRSQYQVSVFKTQAELAGQQAKFNAETAVNHDINYLRSNPSALATMRAKSAAYLQESVATGALSAQDALGVQRYIEDNFGTESVRGWIDLNPEQTLKELKSGAFDKELIGKQKSQMIGEAEQEIRRRAADAEATKAKVDKNRKEQARKEELGILQMGMDGALNSDEIMKSKYIDADDKVKWIKWMGDHYADKMKTSPPVFNELYKRITADENDPYKIRDEKQLQEYLGKGIAFAEYKTLLETLGDDGVYASKSEKTAIRQFETMAEQRIAQKNALGMVDPDRAELYYQFVTEYKAKYREARANGKTHEQLLNVNSPDYMGGMVSTYQRSPKDIMRAQVKAMKSFSAPPGETSNSGFQSGTTTPISAQAPAAPKISPEKVRKPGETLQQWRERTKGP